MATTITLAPVRSSTGAFRTSAWTLSSPNLRYKLPFPVTSPASSRAAASIFNVRLNAARIVKVTIGTVIGCLGIIATWWALDLAMWTAVKEWRDDCRDQKQANGTISSECAEILSQELSQPPIWRSFVSSKIAKRFQPIHYAFKAPPRGRDCLKSKCEYSSQPFYDPDEEEVWNVVGEAPKCAFSFLGDRKLRGARSSGINGLVAVDRGNDSRALNDFYEHLRSIIPTDHRKEASSSQVQYEELDDWDFKEARQDSAAQLDDSPDFKNEVGWSSNAEPPDPTTTCAIKYGGSAADRDNSPFQRLLRQCLREAAFQGRAPPMRVSKHLRVWTALDEWDCKEILDGEIEYDEYDDEECYVEVCRSLADECRGTQSRQSRRRGLPIASSEESSRKPFTISVDRRRKTLYSRAPRKGPYERKLDDMVERAECSTLCGTPFAATCNHWDDHRESAREGIQRQGDAAIMYGGMEGYDNYTAWVGYRQRIRSAKHWETSRVNPIEEPCWWSDSWGRMVYDENREMRCGGGFLTFYDENGVSKEEVEELDWSWWAEKLTWTYDEEVTVSHTGTGSFERLRVEVNQPRKDVWRRGCSCQEPVTNYEIGIGGWNMFDGPSWLFWDMVTTWTAALLMFVYWEWVVGWDLRKRQDAARHRKEGRRRRASKAKID